MTLSVNHAIVAALICMLIGYSFGMLNPAYLISRMRGFDIREHGSGNAGASNAIITMGKFAGLLIALFDIAKAYWAIRLARYLFPDVLYAAEIAGVCAILGHIFPIYMGFRGGKGLACLGGMILAFDAKVFWTMLLIELVLALIVDYIIVVPLTASAAFPFVYFAFTGQLLGAILYALLFPLFLAKHAENLRRIRSGKEAKFSYLWSKDEEVKRMAKEARQR